MDGSASKKKKSEFIQTKVWKESPPGIEQKVLEKMFLNGEIRSTDSPKSIREKNPIFQEFSSIIFGAKFRKTKAKLGINLKCSLDAEIPEISGNSKTVQSSIDENVYEDLEENSIIYNNPPVITWMFTDHEEKCDYVCVAASIISGATDIKFEIAEDGLSVTIFYAWPSALTNAKELLVNDKYGLNHPKIHAFTSSLLNLGITDKSRPKGKIVIPLNNRIQREIGTWSKTPIKKDDGTKILVLTFKGYQPNIILKDADTSVSFD